MAYLPASFALRMKQGASSSAAVEHLLRMFDPRNLVVYDHFFGDAFNSAYATAATNGTAAAATVASSRATFTSGTDDDGYAGLGLGLMWKGDLGFYFESNLSLDTLATSKIEVGITDAVADAGAVATKATPTDTADDFVVLIRDTDDNTELDLIGTIDNGTCTAHAENVYTVVAGTRFTPEFRYSVDTVHAAVNGKSVGTGSCQGGDLITPWWFVQSRAITSSRILTVEYVLAFGPDLNYS